MRMLALFILALMALPAEAASFDCAAASTPFEHAICDNPELSAADDRLARTYATAIGGLSEAALAALRADQRAWLDYARRACTRDAAPLGQGRYDARGVSCLVDLFDSRSRVLEQSRMLDGRRFYPLGTYAALPDPDAAGDPDASWPVAQHELSIVQLDSEEEFATGFNAFVRAQGDILSQGLVSQGAPERVQLDPHSDTANAIVVEEQAGRGRITLRVNTYWYGHGAAHGNWTITYLHYLVAEGRALEAGDLFAGKRWKAALLDLAVAALEAEHGDALMLDDTRYIAESVADPERWDLSDDYGLVIQFQPYEVSAYAYGAPTARISWADLEPYLAETADAVRYGF